VLNGHDYVNMGLSLTGPRKARYRQLIFDIDRAVADYMLGTIAISALATLATWIVLSLLGILGALLAIPTAAAIQIVLRDWWAHPVPDAPAVAP
jgi:predicted PurR-regulated permease PerM